MQHRFLSFAVLATITTVFLVSVPAAVADPAASISPSVSANDQPPFTADQIRKLLSLINGGNGHGARLNPALISALGLTGNASLRSFTLDIKNDAGYEISVLSDNSGYLIAHEDHNKPANSRVFRIDANFELISAVTQIGNGPFSSMPISDANKFYAVDIATWRMIIDKLGGP